METPKEGISIKERLDKYFHNIFSPTHLAYTIFFIIELLVLFSFNFIPIGNIGDIGLFLTTSFSISFIILMIFGIFDKSEKYLFSKSLDQYKVIAFIVSLGIGIFIMLMYFLFGTSSQIPIQFLGWDFILPGFYVIIYFGWNISQIFFLRKPFESISLKVNNKLIKDDKSTNNEIISIIFLIISLIIPVLLQIGTYFGFNSYFETETSQLWFNGWNIAMYCIIAFTAVRLITLFFKSKKNESFNVFSSIFYILIWIIIWYRSFSFVNSFRSVSEAAGIDAFRVIIDVFLMIFTAIMVLRGLGNKVYKTRIFNPNNLAFFLYAFTLIYIEGQIIMVTGAGRLTGTYTFTDNYQINLVNNFMILLITLIFYGYYSEYILEKRGLIFKINYKKDEVIQLISDFKNYLINTGALPLEKISESEFNNFLEKKKLKEEQN